MSKKDEPQDMAAQWEQAAADYAAERHKSLLRHKVPAERTLEKSLLALTKVELADICANLNLHGMSSLRKAELAALLVPEVQRFAKIWCSTMVQEQYDFLQRLSREGLVTAANAQEDMRLDSLLATGLVGCGGKDEQVVWYLPQEIQALIAQQKDLPTVVQQNTEIARLAHGLLFYFGFLPYEELFYRLAPHPEHGTEVQIPQVVSVLMNVASWGEDIEVDSDGASLYAVDEVDDLLYELGSRETLAWAVPSRQQLWEAGSGDYEVQGPFAQPVRRFLQGCGMQERQIDEILLLLYMEIQNGGTLQDGIDTLQHENKLQLTREQWKLLLPILVTYNNTMPQWMLKGHAPDELSKVRHAGKIIPFGQHVQKVGRNDPCPCGSGKKYKNCCLRKDEL